MAKISIVKIKGPRTGASSERSLNFRFPQYLSALTTGNRSSIHSNFNQNQDLIRRT